MNRDSRPDDRIYRSCIAWDVPAIRRSNDEDAIAFVETIQLLPGRIQGSATGATGTRMPPLQRAAAGLQAEISGDPEAARAHYRRIARLPGAQGVLGHLLLAWMADATQDDFGRVEARLGQLVGPGTNDVVARSHSRLAGWALDQGWPDVARHHFVLAKRFAGKELTIRLEEIGHWFGEDRRIYFKTSFGDMVRFPWIVDFLNEASQKSVEDRFEESFKSPWVRTWRFGGRSTEGTYIQSAEMQASWAGALWLAPTIRRQHAAMIMEKSRDPGDVSRAIALWIQGGGSDTRQFVNAFEGHLTTDSVSDLVLNKLHSGRSIVNAQSWLDFCDALWSELPEAMVEDFVTRYPGPAVELRPHTVSAAELSLFAKLVARTEVGAKKLAGLSDEQLALLLRVMPTDLVDVVPLDALQRGLSAAIAGESEEWSATGWGTLARAWSLLSRPYRDQLRDGLLQRIPYWQVAFAASAAGDLVPTAVLEDRLASEIEAAHRDIVDAHSGIFTGHAAEPSTSIAWLSYRLGDVSKAAVTALVELANDPQLESSQRQAGLSALTMLAREGILDAWEAARAFSGVSGHTSSLMVDDAPADQRYEDLQRIALQVSFAYSDAFDGELLAGSRDPSTRVRHLAVSIVRYLSLEGTASPALDGALLGALYDPHPSVQATVMPAIWRGRFASPVVGESARLRVVELWPSAPLELRLSIAREVASSQSAAHEHLGQLAAQCAIDRSVLVRAAAAGVNGLPPPPAPGLREQ